MPCRHNCPEGTRNCSVCGHKCHTLKWEKERNQQHSKKKEAKKRKEKKYPGIYGLAFSQVAACDHSGRRSWESPQIPSPTYGEWHIAQASRERRRRGGGRQLSERKKKKRAVRINQGPELTVFWAASSVMHLEKICL